MRRRVAKATHGGADGGGEADSNEVGKVPSFALERIGGALRVYARVLVARRGALDGFRGQQGSLRDVQGLLSLSTHRE